MGEHAPAKLNAKLMMTVTFMLNARPVFALVEQDLMEMGRYAGMPMSVKMERTNVQNSRHVKIHLVLTLVLATLVSSVTAYYVTQL